MAKKNKQEPMEPLQRWIDDRMNRGDISYIHTVDGVRVYRALVDLYPQDPVQSPGDIEQ